MTGATFGGLFVALAPDPPSYQVSVSATTINEGEVITYTVQTRNVLNGTILYWTNSGTTGNLDFAGNLSYGSFTVDGGQGVFNILALPDQITEGTETVNVAIRTGGITGNIVATATSVTILDTSTPLLATLLIVAGGGGSAEAAPGGPYAGGGGAGGVVYRTSQPFSSGDYIVTVGAGGAAGRSYGGGSGGNSSIVGAGYNLVALGGGGGGGGGPVRTAGSGGSGGGAATGVFNNVYDPYSNQAGYGGTGLQPSSASGGYGNPGGNAQNSAGVFRTGCYPGAGGGGAGGAGSDGYYSGSYYNCVYGVGGSGITFAMLNALQIGELSGGNYYVAGGGGAAYNGVGAAPHYGGGNRAQSAGTQGLVIVNYPGTQIKGSGGQISVVGGNVYHIFTSSATFSINSYLIYPNLYQVFEGGSITVTVQAAGIPDGTVLYWTNTGTTTASDFVNNITSGSVTINGSLASFTLSLVDDLATESNETINLSLRTDSISGNIVATANPITVLDSSTVITYSVAANVTTATEGQTIRYTITSSATRPNGDLLYWTNTGTTVPADLIGNTIYEGNIAGQGTVLIQNNQGIVDLTVANDFLTEGSETLVFTLRTNSYTGNIIGQNSLTITDTSTRPGWSLTPNTYIISEGESITYTLNTSGFANGTTLYWVYTGTISASDLVGAATSGSFVINNNTGTFTIGTLTDAVTESFETINVEVKIGSISGFTVATTSNVYVYDAGYTTNSADYIIVGGGGGGGATAGGGAGGGGVLTGTYTFATATVYPIVIGGGGGASQPTNDPAPNVGGNGGNSTAFGLTALGGGGGGTWNYINGSGGTSGANGGCGGGGSVHAYLGEGSQGGRGGSGYNGSEIYKMGGGGGGGGGQGGSAGGTVAGNGGSGYLWYNGVYYGGGGGGGAGDNVGIISITAGAGGAGGGGAGKLGIADPFGGQDGTGGLGGGGGGGGCRKSSYTGVYIYGNGGGYGGSGVVVIRYRGKARATGGTISQLEGYTYHSFTSSDNWTTN